MTAVRDIVQDAMLEAGIGGADQTPSDADAELVLRQLNRMLDAWGREPEMLYARVQDTFTMTKGAASYSSSLLASTIRPLSIDSGFVSLGGIDTPLEIVDHQSYLDESYKAAEGTPELIYPASGMPNWTFYFYPTPSDAFVCTLVVNRLLATTPLALGGTLTLPPGYDECLVSNLAVRIAPAFGMQPSPVLVQAARSSKYAMKRANYVALRMGDGPSPSVHDAFLSGE